MRNPKWTRDELILALELYFRCPPLRTNKASLEVVELSNLLNVLPLHPLRDGFDKFRNPNGVYMKMCNFLRFDPDYKGKGLVAGGKLEEEIWNEFSRDQERLRSIAEGIKENFLLVPRPTNDGQEEDEEFDEGKILTRVHKSRERSFSAVKKKKESVLRNTGKLSCEVCSFDFASIYGILGKGFAECHHTKPVSELKKGEKIKLQDLSMVCANCHRIIHRSKPMISIKELRELIS